MTQSNSKQSLRFFLGANTPHGFVSYFDELCDPTQFQSTVLLKGGPGTGKSTLMKKVMNAFSENDCLTECCPCSADPDSLDAVIGWDKNICVVDGTPPHILEPCYPGAQEQPLNLCDCWDESYLKAHKDQIIRLADGASLLHKRASRFLSAAGTLIADNCRLIHELTNLPKIRSVAERTFKKELGTFPKSDFGNFIEHRRFLSAVTAEGILLFEDTITSLCDKVYVICDDFGLCSKIFMDHIRTLCMNAGLQIYTCSCPLSPYDKIDHILIPSLSLGFVTSNPFLRPCITPYRTIHFRRFTDMVALKSKKARVSFNRKAAKELLGEAVRLISEAKVLHDELEEIYKKATDFTCVEKLTEKLLSQISN